MSTKKHHAQVKERKFFLNNMNSWFSNFVIEEFRTDYLPEAKTKNEFMGTLNNSGSPLPKLFEPKETKIEIGYNYNQEVFQNDIFIYNLQDSNLSEAEFIIKGLRSLKYETEKVLILISSIMTWGKTPPKVKTEAEIEVPGFNEEEYIETDEPKIKTRPKKKKSKNKAEEGNEIEGKPQEEEEEKDDEKITEIAPKPRVFYHKDSDYLSRVPSKKYLQYKMIETLALANTNPQLKVYIICPGFIYGCGEDFFFDYFKMAWLQTPEIIPLIEQGKNCLPTIHILDLVTVIKKVVDKKPITRYIIAVDKTRNPQMKNIVKSIADCVGNGKVEILSDFNVDEVEIPNFTEMSIDVKVKLSKIFIDEKKRIDEDEEDYDKRRFIWHCQYGIPENLDKLRKEFNLYRGLKNVKIMITGPPSSGKTALASALQKEFNLPHLKLSDIIEEAKNSDEAIGEEIRQKYIEIEETVQKALEDYEKRKNKRKTDPPLDTTNLRKFPSSLITKIVKTKLSQNLCQNQGYILDGYPKKYQDAYDLFMEVQIPPGQSNESNSNNEPSTIKEYKLNASIAPQSVIRITQCTDDLLKERMKSNEEYSTNQAHFDERFNRRNIEYKTNNEVDGTKKVIDFFTENNIEAFDLDGKIKKENYLSEVKLNEYLQRYGICNNKARLCDDEEVILTEQDDSEIQNDLNKLEKDNDNKSEENIESNKEDQKEKILADKLLELKEREKKLLEKKSEVLRRYLSENVIPLLAKGILNVCQNLPDDPVEGLANYLFDNGLSKVDNKEEDQPDDS